MVSSNIINIQLSKMTDYNPHEFVETVKYLDITNSSLCLSLVIIQIILFVTHNIIDDINNIYIINCVCFVLIISLMSMIIFRLWLLHFRYFMYPNGIRYLYNMTIITSFIVLGLIITKLVLLQNVSSQNKFIAFDIWEIIIVILIIIMNACSFYKYFCF
jgi:hypothetical protein